MSAPAQLVQLNAEQAALVVPLLRDEAARRRQIGDSLVLACGLSQAGFNSHDAAAQLDDLADTIDQQFPEIDDDCDDDDDWT
jgi:hypothetical protein